MIDVHRTGLALATLLCVSCRVDTDAFQRRLFACNPSAADPGCGTDPGGAPLVCYASSQLGGQNFCSASCAPRTRVPEEDDTSACLAPRPAGTDALLGARLAKCDPTLGEEACGHPDLKCLRTDLVKDEGVCMPLTLSGKNGDCRDPVRAVCIGQLLRDNYGDKAQLKADGTYCVQFGCQASGAACSPGETCLRKVIPRESRPSDICVPNCDANRNCPPNYFCYPDLYSEASPAVCIPGLLGLRCRNRLDCLIGDCVDSGAGFNVCSVPCADDGDCARFDSEHGTFFCNAQKQCAGARAFRGAICEADAHCRPGEICARISTDFRTGLCLFKCRGDQTCPSHGGVPHMCLPQLASSPGPPVCWPGMLGIPCRTDETCIPGVASRGLQCRPVGPSRVCTTICLDDEDCRRNRFAQEGYCLAGANVCLPWKKDGAMCERDGECESRKCIMGAKTCDKTPGY